MVLIDASSLGEKVKEGKNQKTLLSATDEAQIIDTFNNKETIDDFSTVVSYEDIRAKNYSLSAGQYFEVKLQYVDITSDEFASRLKTLESDLRNLNSESESLHTKIEASLKTLRYE